MLFQRRGDSGVQVLSPSAEQGAIGSVLHQRVLEEVRGVRRRAAAKQQPRSGEPVESGLQLDDGSLRYRLNQLVAKLSANHGPDLPNLLGDRPEPIDPRRQRGV